MRDELGNLAIRIEAWERELHGIQQQYHHNWTIEGNITQTDASDATQAAWDMADELRIMADHVEVQAEQATAMLESAEPGYSTRQAKRIKATAR